MTVQVAVWPRGITRRYAAGPLGETRSGGDTRRVGKPVFMTQVGALESVAVSTRYEDGFGGTDLLSWTVTPHGGFIGGMFRPGDHVRVTSGGGTIGEGEISEVLPQGDGTVEFQARGYAYNLGEYNSVAYDESPVVPGYAVAPLSVEHPSTQLLATAPDQGGWQYAVETLGMPINQVVGTQTGWTDAIGISSVAQRTVTVGQVVTARERLNGRRWAVWGRALVLAADPTSPKWQIDTPEGLVGVADTDYYTHVGVWYRWYTPDAWLSGTTYTAGDRVSYNGAWFSALVSGVSTTPPPDDGAMWQTLPIVIEDWMTNVHWEIDTANLDRFDTKTIVVDYRGAGLSETTTTTVGDVGLSLIEQVKGRFILNGSFTVGPDSGLKSINGGKAPLAFVQAGAALKLNHLRTTQASLMPDVVAIGRTEWRWDKDGSESLTVTPMGAVPRDLGSILGGIPYSDPGGVA